MRVLAAAVGVAVVSAGQCLERYQCIFHSDVGGSEYSWDLSGLCRTDAGRGEYSVALGHSPTVDGQWLAFNICGNTTSICADDPTKQLYTSRGAVVQYIDGWLNDGARYQPSTLDQTTACPTSKPNRSCVDWDSSDGQTPPKPLLTNWQNPNPAMQGCCSDNCEVVATGYQQFSLINPNNPLTGGVRFTYGFIGTDADDNFGCPQDPTSTVPDLFLQRQAVIELSCDPSISGYIAALTATETSTCRYLIKGRTAAACGVLGDPYDKQKYTGGDVFGYTILGAVICVLVQFTYAFADKKGWIDPITRRIPPARDMFGSIPGYDYVANLMGGGGGSSYKTTGGFSTVSGSGGGAATPITQSAYGSA